jgi:hypothetical protein
MPKIPESGTWVLDSGIVNAPPFAVLEVDLTGRTGAIWSGKDQWKKTGQLDHIHLGFGEIDQKVPDRFNATYKFGEHHGRIEAVFDDHGDLTIYFTGTVNNNWSGRSSHLEWGSRGHSLRVAGLSYTDKLSEALNRSLPLMPAHAAHEVRQLMTPAAVSVMAVTTAAWAVSHFFGVGEVADLILIIVGAVMLGATAAEIAKELGEFAKKSLGAESESDLDEAAQHFANAVAKGGVNLISTLLLRRFARRETRPFGENFRQPWTPRTGQPLSTTPGKWFYRAKFVRDAPGVQKSARVRGSTSSEGDIYVSNRPQDYRGSSKPMALERLKTFRHEKLHSFLTPKLQLLRNLRVQLRDGAYQKSHILRYLEEALAEAYGRFGTVGEMPRAIGFPLKHGYTTLAQMGEEAAGTMEGAVNVGGVIYRVFFDSSSTEKKVKFVHQDYVAEEDN